MKKILFILTILSICCIACEQKQKEIAKAEVNTTAKLEAIQTTEEIIADQQKYEAQLVVDGIEVPWGMTWLPDGSMLVTERSGTLFHVKNGTKTSVKNVPEVYAKNQGGLLDIMLHPNYAENGWIYITYSLVDNNKGSHTKLIRAKLKNNALTNIEELYRGSPNVNTAHHFGSRIAFDNDGYLYFTIGDRGKRDVHPQDITMDGGKVYRLHDDGRIPQDNPFVKEPNAKKAIYSYGHRNPQGMALHPETGQLWVHEHGPRGGDEINPIKKGANYGWPVITYGINYSGTTITDQTAKEGMEQPLYYWVPSIAPSGMMFVTSDIYPDLKGHLLVGALKFQYLEWLTLTADEKVAKREKLLDGIGRLRSVRQGPDGYIYVGVDGKGVFKMVPKQSSNTANTSENTNSDASEENTIETTETAETVENNENWLQKNALSDSQQKEFDESMKRGESIYTKYCMQCHMKNGEGYARAFPPLAGSNWLTEKVTESIRSIKYGLSGRIVVNGKVYNGVMTRLGLNDQEVADVMNYTSNSWGNETENVYTKAQVSKVEKK